MSLRSPGHAVTEAAKVVGWALLLALAVILAAVLAYAGWILWHLATKGGL